MSPDETLHDFLQSLQDGLNPTFYISQKHGHIISLNCLRWMMSREVHC